MNKISAPRNPVFKIQPTPLFGRAAGVPASGSPASPEMGKFLSNPAAFLVVATTDSGNRLNLFA